MEAKTTIGNTSKLTIGLVITLVLTVWAAAVSYTSLRKDVEALQTTQGETREEVKTLAKGVDDLVKVFEVHIAKEGAREVKN